MFGIFELDATSEEVTCRKGKIHERSSAALNRTGFTSARLVIAYWQHNMHSVLLDKHLSRKLLYRVIWLSASEG